MHQLAGDFLAIVGAYNATILCENQNINQPPQINQRADQIIATLYNLFSPGAILGKLLDVGFSVFPYAFDGYTFNKTKVIDGLRDAAMSEGGRTWIDRDGTLRFGNRQRMLNAVTKPIKLSVTDGMAYLGHAAVDDSLIVNKAVLTITPRVIGASFVQLAQLTAPVPIPPTPAGQPGTSVTMTFIDPATSKTCGGANVYPPIYTINGGGIDYTLQTTLVYLASVQVLASNAIYTFVNNTNQTLYLTTLTVSGNTVTSYNQIQEIVSDSASMARYQEQSFERALPYGADAGFALTLAQYFINRFKDPFQEVDSLQIDNKSVLNGVDLLGLELLDIVQVSDVQLGVSSQLYAIVGFDYTFDRDAPDYLASMKIYLERMDDSTYWVLADATYGQLGNTTRLSI